MSLLATLEAALLASSTIDDKNVITLSDNGKIWEEHCPIALDDVEKLSTYRSTFSEAYTKAIGSKIVQHVKDTPDVDGVAHNYKTKDVDFGFDFSRPSSPDGVKLTKNLVLSTLASRVTVTGLKKSEEAVSKIADIWDF